jgi:hypothetical protein
MAEGVRADNPPGSLVLHGPPSAMSVSHNPRVAAACEHAAAYPRAHDMGPAGDAAAGYQLQASANDMAEKRAVR